MVIRKVSVSTLWGSLLLCYFLMATSANEKIHDKHIKHRPTSDHPAHDKHKHSHAHSQLHATDSLESERHVRAQSNHNKEGKPENALVHAHPDLYPDHLLSDINEMWETRSQSTLQKYWRTPSPRSEPRHAYVTLLHGINMMQPSKYRYYLLGILAQKTAIERTGSKKDFIVLIGIVNQKTMENRKIFSDLKMLEDKGVILRYIPGGWFERPPTDNQRAKQEEINFAKIFIWGLTDYDRLQYLDADILPIENMDCYFEMDLDVVHIEASSPINGGWFTITPSLSDFRTLWYLVQWRAGLMLQEVWDPKVGWGEIPEGLFNLHGLDGPEECMTQELDGTLDCLHPITDWGSFAAGWSDQGLFVHWFFNFKGNFIKLGRFDFERRIMMRATERLAMVMRNFERTYLLETEVMKPCLKSEDMLIDHHLTPVMRFVHYFDKPWRSRPEGEPMTKMDEQWYEAVYALGIKEITPATLDAYVSFNISYAGA